MVKEMVKMLFPATKNIDEVIGIIEKYRMKFGLNTGLRLAQFLAQVREEVGPEFKVIRENLNYHEDALTKVYEAFIQELADTIASKKRTIIDRLLYKAITNTKAVKVISIDDSTEDSNKYFDVLTTYFSILNITYYQNAQSGQGWKNNTDQTTLQQCIDACIGIDGGGNLCDSQNILIRNKNTDYVIDNFAVAFSNYIIT